MERKKYRTRTSPGWGALGFLSVTGLITGCGIFGGSDGLEADLEYLPAPGDFDEDGQSFHNVYAVDFEAASELSGHEQPAPGASNDEFRDWDFALRGFSESADYTPVYVALPPHRALYFSEEVSVEEIAEEFGFTPLHMDRVTTNWGDGIAGVFDGEIDEELLDVAYGEPAESGVWDAGGADDRERIGAIEVDGRLAFGGDETLQMADEDVATLADVDGAVAVAEAIDQNDWYWSALVGGTYEIEDGAEVHWRGHGVWLEGETHIGHFYWYHASQEAAETNHQLIESQLEEFEQSWEMESLETGLDGQLVTAEVEFTGQPHVIAQTEAKFTPPFY